MASAAGGTNQRLKPAFAIIFSRLRVPPFATAVPSIVPVVSIVIAPEICGFVGDDHRPGVELSGECPVSSVAILSGHAPRSHPLFRGCGCGYRRQHPSATFPSKP